MIILTGTYTTAYSETYTMIQVCIQLLYHRNTITFKYYYEYNHYSYSETDCSLTQLTEILFQDRIVCLVSLSC